MSADPRLSTCVLCPRLCRVACPVAIGTGREAAVPSVLAGVLREWGEGRVPGHVAADAAALCLDCGACERHCHVERPLRALLSEARDALAEHYSFTDPEPPSRIEGTASIVAVCTDDRPFAPALARALGQPVATWRTRDRLGLASLAREGRALHLSRVSEASEHRDLVVADGGVALVLKAAGVPWTWLWDRVADLRTTAGSCMAGGDRPLACCGAAEPLASVHPAEAAQVGRAWVRRQVDCSVRDSRCRDHLLGLGEAATDAIDQLLART